MRKLENFELNRKSIDEYKIVEKIPLVLILDNIRSLHNIGSIFRSSDAFLIEKIYLCGITATPPHRDIQKTALGATESVSWEYSKDTCETISSLKERGVKVIAVEQVKDSISLQNFFPKKSKRYAFVFGNEVNGVSQSIIDMCENAIEIPQEGTKHSLNISISVGLVIWNFYSKFKML
tara:strand:- start:229 stop:762 length:534 start_codon:yes stop_codon:yes gene_type:complete